MGAMENKSSGLDSSGLIWGFLGTKLSGFRGSELVGLKLHASLTSPKPSLKPETLHFPKCPKLERPERLQHFADLGTGRHGHG